MSKKLVFEERYEPSMVYAEDFDFASDFYPPADVRFALVRDFVAEVEKKLCKKVYNCKIVLLPDVDIYNVYLYFFDLSGVCYGNLPVKQTDFEKRITKIYQKCLRRSNLHELKKWRLNPNGVFVRDYSLDALARGLWLGYNEISSYLKAQTHIEKVLLMDCVLYVIFCSDEARQDAIRQENFAQMKEGVFQLLQTGAEYFNKVTFVFDLFSEYQKMGAGWFLKDGGSPHRIALK
ncbi:MAG: hypothetical protein LBQ80_02685 [Clostridium sp.]|jgi:hypothetical protein|nr:hypothetical protein [Clostridium sp.]